MEWQKSVPKGADFCFLFAIATKNLLFRLELSGILLYYDNINPASLRAIACFYSLSVRVKNNCRKIWKNRIFFLLLY